MRNPVITVDFGNSDRQGRIRMNTVGSIRDLSEQGVRLIDGLEIKGVDGEGFEADGKAFFNVAEGLWVLEIGGDGLPHPIPGI